MSKDKKRLLKNIRISFLKRCCCFIVFLFACNFFKSSFKKGASQQVAIGYIIDFLTEAKFGNLVFFENEEFRIVQVGILLNDHQIIRVLGRVKISQMDKYFVG